MPGKYDKFTNRGKTDGGPKNLHRKMDAQPESEAASQPEEEQQQVEASEKQLELKETFEKEMNSPEVMALLDRISDGRIDVFNHYETFFRFQGKALTGDLEAGKRCDELRAEFYARIFFYQEENRSKISAADHTAIEELGAKLFAQAEKTGMDTHDFLQMRHNWSNDAIVARGRTEQKAEQKEIERLRAELQATHELRMMPKKEIGNMGGDDQTLAA